MKKNNYFLHLLAIMMVAVMSLGIASCGSDDDDDSSSNAQLVGLWYENDGDYIHAFCFNADGTGWEGEWRVGSNEKHSARTWKVDGNRLLIYNAKDGDLADDFYYSISSDGKKLTLTDTGKGDVKGVFTKQ